MFYFPPPHVLDCPCFLFAILVGAVLVMSSSFLCLSFLHLLVASILLVFRRHFVWKTERCLKTSSVTHQHSEPCRRVESTQLLYNFSVVLLEYITDFKTVSSLEEAHLAFLMQFLISTMAYYLFSNK